MKRIRIMGMALCLLFALNIHAKTNMPVKEPMEAAGKISGSIIDKQSQLPVEYANIIIIKANDKQMLTGTISNEKGKFTLKDIPFGKYTVKIDFIGYEELVLKDIVLNKKSPQKIFDKLYLNQASTQLEGVEIVAERTNYEYKIDKKVVNVSQDATSTGGTAADVLESIPAVEVDIEGNVTLRGSSSFTVLINGRPSVLEGSDALQQLPVDNIKNIEIITNPSAKYDPDGTAGIINVILKKQNQQGFGGIINLSAGSRDKYSSNLLFNYKIKKLNITAGFDYRDDKFHMMRESERKVFADNSTSHINAFGGRIFNRKGISGKLGIEYSFTNQTILGFNAKLGESKFVIDAENFTHQFTDPATTNFYRYSQIDMKREADYYELDLNLHHKFDDKGQQIDFFVYYSKRDGEDLDSSIETETDDKWVLQGDPYYSNRGFELGDSKQYRAKVDYVKPFASNGKFEAGYQLRINKSDEDYDLEELVSGNWVSNSLYKSNSEFNRDIHAVYAILNKNSKIGFGYQIGLRGEYTKRETGVKDATEVYTIDRIDLFPSIHFSQQLDKHNQFILSYSRRINRPRGRFLDPFLSYRDENNRWLGDPGLKPEYIDSFEFGWNHQIGRKANLNIEAYYTITNDMISRILTNTNEGYVIHTATNIDKDKSLGLEAMLKWDLSKKFNITLSGRLYKYKIEGGIGSTTVNQESTNWRANLNTTYKFSKHSRLQYKMGYRGTTVTAQGERKGFFTSDIAYKQDLWKKKASITLQVQNLFKTMGRDMIITGDGYWEHFDMTREARTVKLSFSYKINNFKMKKQERNGNGEQMDMDF